MDYTFWLLVAVVVYFVVVQIFNVLGNKAVKLTQPEPATSLTRLSIVKGSPIPDFEKDHVYVVEFWATWCPPCRSSIPHLSELQAKFRDSVTFVGVTNENENVVRPFVDKMGNSMSYTVAIDTDGSVNRGYMSKFSVRGIPHAFIVNKLGQVFWHGHPMDAEFETALQEAINAPSASSTSSTTTTTASSSSAH
eukprot:GEZU01012578.1.p1 GENE.GEZU01012578.1~~GEZU01012578.1.p1  ORF type:complete len:193 (-),score=42.44 GEZU01012578.1:157-735(-)